MRFRVPLRLKSTSSLAVVAAASWLGVGRCLRLPTVSLACRGDQAAGLRLRADQAGLPAESPRIGDPAGVLHGGARAHVPFPRGLQGVAVAESAPRISGKTGSFRQPKKERPVLQAAYAYLIGDRNLRRAGIVFGRRGWGAVGIWFPSSGLLTTLSEVVGSRPTQGARTLLAVRDSPPQRDAETDDRYGDCFQGVLS